ncbi:MAG TPA: hypothetical protein VNO30_50120 [Kofleriaceae bacterium]|nr:hypothetical protein [Kofleriaceae bacterium]
MSTFPERKTRPPRRSRKDHTAKRHGDEPARVIRVAPEARKHVVVIEALEAIGWRVNELRPSIDRELWHVTIERVDLVASMTVTAPDPDVALEELARYAAADAPRA